MSEMITRRGIVKHTLKKAAEMSSMAVSVYINIFTKDVIMDLEDEIVNELDIKYKE